MFFCGDSWKLWRTNRPVQGEEMAASCLWVSGRKSPHCIAMLVTVLGPSHPNAVSCIFFKMACKKLMKSIWQTSTRAFQVTLLVFWLEIHPNEKKKKFGAQLGDSHLWATSESPGFSVRATGGHLGLGCKIWPQSQLCFNQKNGILSDL